MAFDFISTDTFVDVPSFALAVPPSWTRLEPQTRSGDPRPGLEARVHDPLWLLGRQWQLGEFEGEDAGTPLTVRVVTTTVAIDRWAASAAAKWQPLGAHDLLEPLVEAETGADALGPGLRARAEAGAALLAALEDQALVGVATYRQALVDHCPLDVEPSHHPGGAAALLDPVWVRLSRLLTGRGLVDAESACSALEDAGAAVPAWLVPDPADDT